MGRRISIIIIMLCLFLVACPRTAIAAKEKKLSLAWSPGLCLDKQRKCNKEAAKDELTIHGLWVAYNRFDRSCQLDIELLSTVMEELKKSWPSLLGSNEDLWKNEWCKHGVGSPEFGSNQTKYFEKALQLKNDFNLDGVLTPSDTTPRQASAIADAIKKKTHKIPEITCLGQGKPKSKVKVLEEVRICLSLSQDKKISVEDCTAPFTNACKAGTDEVLVPKAPTKVLVPKAPTKVNLLVEG